jgi:hypothetical protein
VVTARSVAFVLVLSLGRLLVIVVALDITLICLLLSQLHPIAKGAFVLIEIVLRRALAPPAIVVIAGGRSSGQ